MNPGMPDRVILRWLARRTNETASGIGAACGMAPGEVRAHLVTLESTRLVASRQGEGTLRPQRVYYVTAEGRRAVGIVDARSTSKP